MCRGGGNGGRWATPGPSRDEHWFPILAVDAQVILELLGAPALRPADGGPEISAQPRLGRVCTARTALAASRLSTADLAGHSGVTDHSRRGSSMEAQYL